MIKDILRQDKWRVFNITIAKALGVNETLVLMELADKEAYFKQAWFFTTYAEIADQTALTEYAVKKAVGNLKAKGIIKVKMFGMPAKQHFQINDFNLIKAIDEAHNSDNGQDPTNPTGQDPTNPTGQDPTNSGGLYRKNIDRKNLLERTNTPAEINSAENLPDVKAEKKEKKKNSAAAKKEKKTSPYFAPFRKIFESYYSKLTNSEYYWQVKDSVALNSIIKKVTHAYQTATPPIPEPTPEQMLAGFEAILKRALNDSWIRRNFEVTIINSKFNNLKINGNGTQTESDRQKFGNVINEILGSD